MDTVFDNEDQEMEIMKNFHSMKGFDEVFQDMKPFWIAYNVWNGWSFNPKNPDDKSLKFEIWDEYFVWDGDYLYSIHEDNREAWERWQVSLRKKKMTRKVWEKMDIVSDLEKKMKTKISGLFDGLREDEQVEITRYLLMEITAFREKTEEYVRSLEIKNDSLNEENKKLKKEIEELKNLSKEEK